MTIFTPKAAWVSVPTRNRFSSS